ncbi:MAG: redoxin domain-containing protein [Acidobacteria bacterium]|nr:redoxin domain-containing protein [Acidobacteriota bacterium]
MAAIAAAADCRCIVASSVKRLGGWAVAGLVIGTLVAGCALEPAGPAGLWDATVVVGGDAIPFRFEIATNGAQPTGAFFDGDLRVRSTTGRFEHGRLTLAFDSFGSRLEATLKDGQLEGQYDRGTRGAAYPFRAQRAVTRPAVQAPSIAGLWTIPVTDSTHEAAWRFVVRQSGADVSASILRLDGDTGTLSGSYRDGHFVLSHFAGVGPELVDVTIAPDGTLRILQNTKITRTAVRADDPRAVALPGPTDPANYTRVKNPAEPLAFSFPDLDGRLVSNTDSRFHGKVVIVSIMGSWCPNCHDEAPLLVELDRAYRARGLEIVALAFEEAAQLTNPARLRAFMARYGIQYTVLLAGEPVQLNEKVPQGENLYAFPTSFILGRDGRARFTHVGFSSLSTGVFHADIRRAVVSQIEGLLQEGAGAAARAVIAGPASPALGEGVFASAPAALSSHLGPALKSRQLDFTPTVRPGKGPAAFDLVLEVTPHPGMHVYAPGAKGYQAIGLTLVTPPGVSAKAPQYPAAEDYFFKPLNEHVAVYQTPFRIVTRVARDASTVKRTAPVTIPAIVTYQACDDSICYKPERVAVTFTTEPPPR